MTAGYRIVSGDTVAITVMGELFERAFNEPYGAAAVADLTKSPATWSYVCFTQDGEPVGFVIGMTVCETAEIYSIGVDPAHRERGYAKAMMETVLKNCAEAGAEKLFLEVSADNNAAIGLYSRLGFSPQGRRKDYYRRGDRRIDAVVMVKLLQQ